MRKILVSAVLALVLVTSAAVPAFAADYAGVTVTATPLYLSITNTNDDTTNLWLINGIAGTGLIEPSSTYYAKGGVNETTAPSATVLGTECYFTVTCSAGATTCDLTVTWSDFTLGGANMLNSEDGVTSVDATHYGAYSWYEGMTTYASSKVIVKTAGSLVMFSGLDATVSKKWGVEIHTQTGGWSSGDSSTSTLTITATAT